MFDSLTIYCLATGKPIAQICDDEAGFILESQPAAKLEELALASMRPSLAWMNITPESLDRMRDAAPKQLLAYLLNRMYAPLEKRVDGKQFDQVAWLNARRFRVQMWQIIDSANFGPKLDDLLFLLLDLDSRFNLSKLNKPQSITALWQNWHESYVADILQQLGEWRATLIAAQIKAQRAAADSDEFWGSGNKLTRKALWGQFQKVAPPTPSKLIRKAKIAKLADSISFLDDLEAELMERSAAHRAEPAGESHNAAPVSPALAVPAPKAAPVRLMRFGKKG